jgi:hypothetical protein
MPTVMGTFVLDVKTIHDAKHVLEGVLPTALELHNSLHFGGDYYINGAGSQAFRVFRNSDFEDETITGVTSDRSAIVLEAEHDGEIDVKRLLDNAGIVYLDYRTEIH